MKKQRLQELAGINEALPVPSTGTSPAAAKNAEAMMRELSELLQLVADIDIDKALQLDQNTQKKLGKMAGDLNKFLKQQSNVLGR